MGTFSDLRAPAGLQIIFMAKVYPHLIPGAVALEISVARISTSSEAATKKYHPFLKKFAICGGTACPLPENEILKLVMAAHCHPQLRKIR
jgi:hypothetical protein